MPPLIKPGTQAGVLQPEGCHFPDGSLLHLLRDERGDVRGWVSIQPGTEEEAYPLLMAFLKLQAAAQAAA